VEVDTVGWNVVVWPTPLTVFTDPLDTFFLVKLPSESDVGGGRPGNGLETTNGGRFRSTGAPTEDHTRAAGDGEGFIVTSSAEDRGVSRTFLGVRNLLIYDPDEGSAKWLLAEVVFLRAFCL